MSEASTPSTAGPTLTGTLVNIIRHPATAMRDSEDHTIWLLAPMVLVITAVILHVCFYYAQVDMEWMFTNFETENGEPVPEEARRMMLPNLMALGTSVMITIALPVMVFMWAVWFWLVERFATGSEAFEFFDWYALGAWSIVPLGIGSLLSLLFILTLGAEQTTLNDTWFYSVNALITRFPSNHPASALMSAATPFMVWMVWLAGVGHATLTGRTRLKSTIIVAVPVVAVFAAGIAGSLDI